jgi:hypothetical protein
MNTNDALERHTLLVRLRIKVAVQTCKECLFDGLQRAITSTGQQESIAELVFLELDRNRAASTAATVVRLPTRGSAGLSSSEEPGVLRPLRALASFYYGLALDSSLYYTQAPQLLHALPPTRAFSHTQDAPAAPHERAPQNTRHSSQVPNLGVLKA